VITDAARNDDWGRDLENVGKPNGDAIGVGFPNRPAKRTAEAKFMTTLTAIIPAEAMPTIPTIAQRIRTAPVLDASVSTRVDATELCVLKHPPTH